MRDRINAKLATVTPGNRDLFEKRYIREELEQNSFNLRLAAGLGPDATHEQRQEFESLNRIRELADEEDRIAAELAEVVKHDTQVDPATGNAKAVPVYRVEGERRRALEARLIEISHQVTLIRGHEGRKARAKDAAIAKERAELVEDHAAAEEMAREMARKARREALAAVKIKGMADFLA
jgi:hypothetical protein